MILMVGSPSSVDFLDVTEAFIIRFSKKKKKEGMEEVTKRARRGKHRRRCAVLTPSIFNPA